ncbi:MAG: hypothetical protein FWF92_00580 [Oscillospiraceae bacterium]|nr:hypothetical protein [Oscillospiraceae bacterium]
MASNKDYLFYTALLKSNSVKGANALEGMLLNKGQANELMANDAAMTVIFEPMTTGGARYLPDIFFRGNYRVGKGLQTYLRAIDSAFDPSDYMGGLSTTDNLCADANAMALIAGRLDALKAMLKSPYAASRVVASATAKNALFNSPLKTTVSVVVDYSATNNWTRRTNLGTLAWIATARHTLSAGSGNYVMRTAADLGANASASRANTYNTDYRIDRLISNAENAVSNVGFAVSPITQQVIIIEP